MYAPTFDKKLKRVINRNFDNPNFPTTHLAKDIALLGEACHSSAIDCEALHALLAILGRTVDTGLADADYSALYQAVVPEQEEDQLLKTELQRPLTLAHRRRDRILKKESGMERLIASILFADVVDYSKLSEPQLERFVKAIFPKIAEILRVGEHKYLELNTWGDGLVAVSKDPLQLTEVALSLRDFFRHHDWPKEFLPKTLACRTALHAGVVFTDHNAVRQSEGVVGTHVNLAARIEPVTPPGEVWASKTFHQLVANTTEGRVDFDDLGEQELAKQFGATHLFRLRRAHEAPMTAQDFTATVPKSLRMNALRIPSDSHSVMEYVVTNGLLNTAKRIDLWLYTAETLIYAWRQHLEERVEPLKIRALIRRPERDEYKRLVSEATSDTIDEIVHANEQRLGQQNLDVEVRFYDEPPLVRMQSFISSADDSCTCLAGLYRYDPKQAIPLIGAENNTMAVLRSDNQAESLPMDVLHSRFGYAWQRSSPVRACVCDMDGVLVDSMPAHHSAWAQAFQEAGVEFDADRFAADVYRYEGQKGEITVRRLYEHHAGPSPSEEKLTTIVRRKREIHLELSNEVSAVDCVFELFDYLTSKSIPVSLVTGTTRQVAEGICQRLFPDIFRFDQIVCGSDVDQGKPHPKPYLMAIEKLGISSKHKCVVIENAPLGVESASKAGTRVLGLLVNSPLKPKDLTNKGASAVFRSYTKLIKHFDAISFKSLAKEEAD